MAKIYKKYSSQEERNEYWNSVTEKSMDTYLFSKNARRFVIDIADKKLRELKKLGCETVLDVGCGYVPLMEQLRYIDMKYTGVDPAVAIIEKARKKVEKLGLTKVITLRDGYVDSQTEKHDVVMCLSMTGTFDHQESLVFFENMSKYANKFFLITTLLNTRAKNPKFNSHSEDEMKIIAKKIGAKDLEIIIDPHSSHFCSLFDIS